MENPPKLGFGRCCMASHEARIQASFPAVSWALTLSSGAAICLIALCHRGSQRLCPGSRSREGAWAAPDFMLKVLLWGEGLFIMYLCSLSVQL